MKCYKSYHAVLWNGDVEALVLHDLVALLAFDGVVLGDVLGLAVRDVAGDVGTLALSRVHGHAHVPDIIS